MSMKKTLSWILAVTLTISCLTLPAGAAAGADDLAARAERSVGKSCFDLNLPSTKWCCYFVRYCFNHSDVSSWAGAMSMADGANPMALINWVCAKKQLGSYYSLSSTHYDRLVGKYPGLSIVSASAASFEPNRGDIIIFDWNGREDGGRYFSHAGIVTEYNPSTSKVTWVDGNSETGDYTYVTRKSMGRRWDSIIGYIRLDDENFKQYTLYLDAQGGTVSPSSVTYTYGVPLKSLPTPTRDGYTFKGWMTSLSSPAMLATAENAVYFKEDTTLYARWEKSKTKEEAYKVTLDDGSTCQLISVTNGETYGSLPTPTRDGYTFNGWYTSASGGTKVTSSTTVNLSANQTLYAHWTKKSETHTKGEFLFFEATHPHYNYYTCSVCGQKFTDGTTVKYSRCDICYPPTAQKTVNVTTGQYYTVKNMGSGKYLNVYGNRSTSGTNVTIWEYDGTSGEDFQFVKSGSSYVIVPRCGTSCALNVYGYSAKAGSNVCIWTKSGHNTQAWIVDYNSTLGGFVIRSADNSGCVLAASGSANGNNVCLQQYDPNNKYQVWTSGAFSYQ